MLMRPLLTVFVGLSLVLGVAYPVVVTGAAQTLFPKEAMGSLLMNQQQVLGSKLLAQPFERPENFWGRLPSNAQDPNNSMASGGANLAATNPILKQEVQAKLALFSDKQQEISADLLSHSASGLDPQIGLLAATQQIERVAVARHLPVEVVTKLVMEHTEKSSKTGFVPLVNVVALNVALNQLPTLENQQ